MRVRMAVQFTGTRNGQLWPTPGTVIDLPDDEGAQYVAQGWAEAVVTRGTRAVETATLPPAEVSDASGQAPGPKPAPPPRK